ncbi:hypothetical protein GCM10009547_45030 [Sporichthya brevicatena]|uniref:non-specific serine/threonine protein kinase n=1 Tax=Sporichthya brevicatena TaxID=171442 RepID=A0ABN1HAP3_9ACTN
MTAGAEPLTRTGWVHVVAGQRFGRDGRYLLLRLLGTGGMASVWVADDTVTGREVALKILSDSLALDPAFVARFAREAKLAASLDHPGVVRILNASVLDASVEDGDERPYLAMEYVPGGTLADRISTGGLDRWDLTALARDLLGTLTHLHDAGVLHRDLKPANVLLGTDGRVRLTDFGVAQLADGTRVTGTGELVGTQRYLAPEVLAGDPADVRSDLYSCGVLLAESAGDDVSPPVHALIARLTQDDPARRPSSAVEALALLAGGEPTSPIVAARPSIPAQARPAPPVPAPTLPVRSAPPVRTSAHTPPRMLIAGVAAAVVLVTAGVVLTSGKSEAPRDVPVPPQGSLSQQFDGLDAAIEAVRR